MLPIFLLFLLLFICFNFNLINFELFTKKELENDENIKKIIKALKWAVDNKKQLVDVRLLLGDNSISSKEYEKLIQTYISNDHFISIPQVQSILINTNLFN